MKRLSNKSYILNIIAAICLCCILVFSIAGCNAPSSELQSKIEVLQSQLEELKNQQVDMNNKIVEMENKIEQLEQDLAEISGDNIDLKNSSIVSLEDAYNDNLLTEKDLMHISFFLTGKVYKVSSEDDLLDSSKWEEIEFSTEQDYPIIEPEIEENVKTLYYFKNIKEFQNNKGEIIYDKDILNVEYFGCYNDSYVVRINSEQWSFGASVQTICIGGIVWQQSQPFIKVIRFDN